MIISMRLSSDVRVPFHAPPQTRFEVITEAGSKKKYLVLYYVRLEGQESEMPLVDLLTLDDEGLICRLENCFDTTKCPQEIIDAGAPTLVGFEG